MKLKFLTILLIMSVTLIGCSGVTSHTDDTDTSNDLLEQYEHDEYLLFVYEEDSDLVSFEASIENVPGIEIYKENLNNYGQSIKEINQLSSTPTLLVIKDGKINRRITNLDEISSFLDPYKMEVPLSTQEEVELAFSNNDSFLLVLGVSECSYCVAYKEQTLPQYEEDHLPLKFMYVDYAFTNQSDWNTFVTTHKITYQASPTTYLVNDGIIINRIEGYVTIDSLNDFIDKHTSQEQEQTVVEKSLTDLETAFEQNETFMLVLGMSYCSYCVEYKDTTLEALVNEHPSFPLKFMYTDRQMNSAELSYFLTTHNLTYELSPTTYLIKEGEVERTLKGYYSSNELYTQLSDTSLYTYLE